MNVLSIIGSPRKKGNTSLMCDMLFDSFDQTRLSAEKLFISDYNIKPCIDCRACKKGKLVCTVKDDMQLFYDKINQTDIIIFGIPIYWYAPSAQMKAMIDRFRPYFYNRKLKGKKLALLLSAGSGKPDCELTIIMIKRMCEALEVGFLGAVTAEAYDEGDVLNNASVSNAIIELSKVVNSMQ